MRLRLKDIRTVTVLVMHASLRFYDIPIPKFDTRVYRFERKIEYRTITGVEDDSLQSRSPQVTYFRVMTSSNVPALRC